MYVCNGLHYNKLIWMVGTTEPICNSNAHMIGKNAIKDFLHRKGLLVAVAALGFSIDGFEIQN